MNRPETEEELEALRRSVPRGSPYCEAGWQKRTAVRLKLESSLRDPWRPKKAKPRPPREISDMPKKRSIIPVERIENVILLIRGRKVILDADLAKLYGVPTKRLNEQVKRNPNRFPEDFMFQLGSDEKAEVVANCDHLSRLKFSPSLPYAFTEHGAIMAANVLNSARAVEVSVFVVRAFIKLRQMLSTHETLARKLDELERKVQGHDHQIVALIDAIRRLTVPAKKPRRTPIGYHTEAEGKEK